MCKQSVKLSCWLRVETPPKTLWMGVIKPPWQFLQNAMWNLLLQLVTRLFPRENEIRIEYNFNWIPKAKILSFSLRLEIPKDVQTKPTTGKKYFAFCICDGWVMSRWWFVWIRKKNRLSFSPLLWIWWVCAKFMMWKKVDPKVHPISSNGPWWYSFVMSCMMCAKWWCQFDTAFV